MEEIVKRFFLWKPLDRNLLHDVITKVLESDPSLENFQHRLLDRTTKSDTFQQFPVHSESKSYFFQTLLALLEKFKVDILDEVYENAVPISASEGQHYFKSYFFKDGVHLCSLLETKTFVSHGTTGLKTWPAAEYLFEYFQENKILTMSQKVLEIGSGGTGFLGIACLKKKLQMSEWIFTDHSEAVLVSLKDNVTHNKLQPSTWKISKLDWEDEKHVEFDYDIIVGSDIVFDVRIVDDLSRTLKRLMRKGQKTIIANVERNVATKEAFETSLARNGLEFNVQRNDFNDNIMLLYQIEMQANN